MTVESRTMNRAGSTPADPRRDGRSQPPCPLLQSGELSWEGACEEEEV